jgi:hypothetical protein
MTLRVSVVSCSSCIRKKSFSSMSLSFESGSAYKEKSKNLIMTKNVIIKKENEKSEVTR